MTSPEHEVVDRTGWPPGPWDDEPDRVDFPKLSGFPAFALRSPQGNWCGYVGVPAGHPCYRRGYEGYHGEADEHGETLPDPVGGLEVHGGITYTHQCEGRICHVPEPGEPDDIWWLGFDCAHAGDLTLAMFKFGEMAFISSRARYRDIAYVRAECEKLAAQFAELVRA